MDVMEEDVGTPPNNKKTVETWLKKFEDGELTTNDFCKYWIQWVPKLYSPGMNQSCLNWHFDEECAKTVLFDVLEEFICAGDPAVVLPRLSELDKPPTVCGRVFKIGEPTYSCRECGMDHTCVLCVDCFKHSEHRRHKYRMGTSQGGGCCDCGDAEAWRRAPACSLHAAPAADRPAGGLPADLQERARLLFDAVLLYAHTLLSTGQIADVRLGAISESCFEDDSYCTILYNDEVHTFEQVIGTLTRVMKCTQRTAIDFVTNIDREGRAVVQCSTFNHCMELRMEIEKYTSKHGNKPLKVLVSHAHVIGHQLYGMKLLSWLQNFLGNGEGFRTIFASVALKPQGSEPCYIRAILIRDWTLWKSARSQWHHLLISGMLLEYENKKALAKIFTRNYGVVMKDFIKDDHDHAFSISSISVQLFTVPTLAHHLIENDDVIYILINAFLSECIIKLNKAGKLEFEKSPASQPFKRAHYMLYDLRYLLSTVPDQWNDELRKKFLHGLFLMLFLLTKMQGMDAVTRQVGQHMEYEPEWESAFNLHIRLAYCISLAIKWCATDKVILVKTYREVLKLLEEERAHEVWEPIELADHSTNCIIYDVAARPVSIHLPVSRFLAGLHLALERFGMRFEDIERFKPTPVEIMEPVLRGQVMIAQVHAGKWRRNGYALLNQLFFYHNVKCRTEMLDRDISLLQMCASLIESNEFLIHVLYKFNLVEWASANYETQPKPQEEENGQPNNIVEEFLQLLLVIIGERYMPGVSNITDNDRFKKEIIQYLCIKPLSHSELNKIVSDEHGDLVDDIIEELATFKKPKHSSGRGVYELKDEYYNQYNIFFYHYTREELSKSEEAQRKRRKAAGELDCCPPPKLLKLNESFHMLVNLLQCDVMLHVLQLILQRCIDLRSRSFSELQLHKVLHLIGYALQEEESNNYPFFKFVQNASKFKIFELLNTLVDCKRVESHKELIKWTLRKYNEVGKCSVEAEPASMEEPTTSAAAIEAEKAKWAKFAAERRAKILAQMHTQQSNFMKENAQLFEEGAEGTGGASAKASRCDDKTNSRPEPCDESAMDVSEAEEQPIALGPLQSPRLGVEKSYVCILCQEEETVTRNGPTLVLAAFVQQSTVLCQSFEHRDQIPDPLYLNATLGPAPHTSTCGHVMHAECWRKFFDGVMVREHRRPYRLRHPISFDVDKQEFLCPLCECLSNTVLPLVPPLNVLQPSHAKNYTSFDDYLRCLNVVLNDKVKECHGTAKCDVDCKNVHCAACMDTSDDPNGISRLCEINCPLQPYQVLYSCDSERLNPDVIKDFNDLFPTEASLLEDKLKEMVETFAQVTYTRGLNVLPHPNDSRVVTMTWKSLSYTIHSIEILLRDANKPLLGNLSSRQRDCIESLVRIVGVLGSTSENSKINNNHALSLLEILFCQNPDGPGLIDIDYFGFLLPLTFSLPGLSCQGPTPIPTGGTLDWHNLRLIFTLHIVRILFTLEASDLDDSMDMESVPDESLIEVLKALDRYEPGANCEQIWMFIEYATIPFLRCCCLFYHYLTDVPPPVVLTEIGGDTFAHMCAYLNLPQTPKELFDSPRIIHLIQIWCVNLLSGNCQYVKEPMKVPHLIDLPSDYSELINEVSTFTCPKSEEDSRTPSMCLVCGKVVCAQSYCCQMEQNSLHVGACNYHTQVCGAGIGIFLRVRECEVLFLATPQRGAFVLPPYLDDYGETDMGLKRGNPLRLCEERYKKLQRLWLSHSVHEEIARSIEGSTHVTTQWHHL